MTDYMKALPVIIVQPACLRDHRAKGVQFQLTCNLCRESHKTQVWLCFLVLSFLSIHTCVAAVPGTAEVLLCLEGVKQEIQKSDAMLYAPSASSADDKVKAKCKEVWLRCYMLELKMVLDEERIANRNADCILDFYEKLSNNTVGCPPCEAYALKNITVFLERLNNLFQEINTNT
ncbi:hypothetical protein D5F01_LYC00433 [Larimichthys crocea]|uniref:Uncharacterized protein n=2 Tax=Larimichthys crocea TaxID=215358 RepID=A0ACD3RX50_LARCR|nr:interleukin-15 isoform X1 [Larimichthys crocea]KAE8300296.1 hypothetical protein D5F01_LYC00433 [Larimichthys crocea]TMS23359.1 hypothetical protein E3U43_008665 [Larimichthys crocea]